MAMILNILIALLGISLLFYSLLESRVYGSLYFDRDHYCIERFRRAQKATDIASCCHNVAKGCFGFLLVAIGLTRFAARDVNLDGIFLMGFSLSCLDALVLELTTRCYHLKETREAIMQQWKSQKRVTAENDHEVNMYRAARRLTVTYPRHLVAMGCGLLIIKLLLV